MLKQIINDLETYPKDDLKLLGKFYNINTNIDSNNLVERIANKIVQKLEDSDMVEWNKYCKMNYIPNVIENTRIQLLKEIVAGKNLYELVKDLPIIGKSSTNAQIYDYSPTTTTSAVIKVVQSSPEIKKDVNISQLLSGETMFPYVFMTEQFGSNDYIVMEKLGPTFMDLIDQKVPTATIKKIIREVLDAINIMKSYGIVHTDLKPDNIMLRCTGADSYQTVIIDFDLVNNPDREIEKYELFDVYDFMRRLHDIPDLEVLYPAIHKKVTSIYLQLDNGVKKLTRIKDTDEFKKMFA